MHVVLPPCSDGGVTVAIRKFSTEPLTTDSDDIIQLREVNGDWFVVLNEKQIARILATDLLAWGGVIHIMVVGLVVNAIIANESLTGTHPDKPGLVLNNV